jgi:pimeloyl-ACP methyl ester carboxylesterase
MSTSAHIICTGPGEGAIKISYDSTYPQSTPLQVEDEQSFTAVRLGLVPDYGRDGGISETDRTNAVNNSAFRFWVNNDKDIDAREGDNTPGATEPDCADVKVNGLRDLNDWMPLMIDASEVIGTIGMKKYSYWLCHEDAAVNILLRPDGTPFAYPDGEHSCNSHIFDPETANYLLCGIATNVTRSGIEVTSQISAAIKGKATILLEGRSVTRGTDKCLTLEIRSKIDGSVAYKYRFAFSLDTVTSMYRQLNTRSLCGGEGGMSTQTDQPPNLPDNETKNKHIVYVHGYNMNGSDAVGEQSAVFKNLWWCGSNARFHGVSWHGDATQILALGKTPNFYTNTVNAFVTAPHVSTYIQGLVQEGEVTVIAHSLGNMVASAAISLYHAPATNYFMLDAAVAQEAYNGSELKTHNMVNANWSELTADGYPNVLFASEWHSLFPVTDARRKLTMRGLFTNMVNTSVCNFYSSGEDVVGNAPYGYADDWSDSSISGLDAVSYAWCAQEKNKGRIPRKADLIPVPSWWDFWSGNRITAIWSSVGAVETYANDWLTAFLNEAYPYKEGGWMINKANLCSAYSMPMDWLGVACYRKKTLPEMIDRVLTGEAIWSLRPLFTMPSELTTLNNATASSYAETNRFFLLAHVFPATTYGMGSNPTGSAVIDNWNMNDLHKCMSHGWWEDEEFKWTHSDFKNVTLLYTQEVYKEMIMRGKFK